MTLYTVETKWCSCHPETCCCFSFELLLKGEIVAVGDDRVALETIASKMNESSDTFGLVISGERQAVKRCKRCGQDFIGGASHDYCNHPCTGQETAVVPTNPNTGHGHVRPRPDGVKARCGGPGICNECSREAARGEAHG